MLLVVALFYWRALQGSPCATLVSGRGGAGFPAKLFALARGIGKRLQLHLILRNKSISKVFLLNNACMADQLNQWHPRRRVFASIPDPIPAAWPDRSEVVAAVIPDEKKCFTFLLAGSMVSRKGCLEVLNALEQLIESAQAKVCLPMWGRFRKDMSEYRDLVRANIERMLSRHAKTSVEMIEGFVANDTLDREFADSDCVLIPYQQFYGSSNTHAPRRIQRLRLW